MMKLTSRTSPMSQLRALIVDDDSEQRMLVSRLLADHGVTSAVHAADGSEAIDLAALHQPHVILLDLAMPGRSGFDVLPDIQQASPDAAIVILSNLPQRRLGHKLRQRGAVGYVDKRALPSDLITEIMVAAAITELARDGLTVDLPDHTSAPRIGRRLIRNLLIHRDQALVADVELLVSELVTNAIVHASSAPQLEVRLSTRTIRVSVHDADPALPELRVPDSNRPGGRGLHLLNTLASRWGTDPSEAGKVVWFEIDRHQDAQPDKAQSVAD
jgi:CheY-like chemotaxis protein/anti-sigma regulatory factor (Ser/Thr protein kinase)